MSHVAAASGYENRKIAIFLFRVRKDAREFVRPLDLDAWLFAQNSDAHPRTILCFERAGVTLRALP